MKGIEKNPPFPPLSLVRSGKVFFRWWREELVSLLPKALRRQLQNSEHRLVINFLHECVRFTDCKRGHTEASISVTPDERGDLKPEESAALLNFAKQGEGNVVVGLDHEHVLSLSFPLPLEAEKNLHEVVGYELGRHAPFKIEQVYFDYSVVERQRSDKKLWVSVIVVPRKQLEPKVGLLRAWGLTPSVITVAEPQEGGGNCVTWLISIFFHRQRGGTVTVR